MTGRIMGQKFGRSTTQHYNANDWYCKIQQTLASGIPIDTRSLLNAKLMSFAMFCESTEIPSSPLLANPEQ
jgi:hypothetical protein